MSINYTSSYKTTLKARVVITPEQLNNDLYMNIKDNLSARLVGKVYKDYGFISTIYNIQSISKGYIKQEDNDCNVEFDVSFFCRIVKPTIGDIIIAKISSMTQDYIMFSSGSIKAVVKNTNISDKYYYDAIKNAYVRKENNKELDVGDYFKIEVNKYRIAAKESTIYITASLVEDASDEDVDRYYNSVYDELYDDEHEEDNVDVNDILE